MFTSLGATILRVILHDCAHMFIKKATISKKVMTQFGLTFSTQIKCKD